MNYTSLLVDYLDPETGRLRLCRGFIVVQPYRVQLHVVPRYSEGIATWATDDHIELDNRECSVPWIQWYSRYTPLHDFFRIEALYAAAMFNWLAEREDFTVAPTGTFYPLEEQWNNQRFQPADFVEGVC